MLKAISFAGYLGMVGGLLGLFAMRAVFSASPFTIAVQVAALLLFAWARIAFGWRSYHVAANPTEGGLITRGPYRCIRHPIYTAMCAFAWAGIPPHWSWAACLCGTLIVAGAQVRMPIEEKLVTTRYPEYAEYVKKTWRMIPYVFVVATGGIDLTTQFQRRIAATAPTAAIQTAGETEETAFMTRTEAIQMDHRQSAAHAGIRASNPCG